MFSKLKFDNRFADTLPADQDDRNTRREVLSAAYSSVSPKSVVAPKLVALSKEMLVTLGLPDPRAEPERLQDFVAVMSGNELVEGMAPYAMCYGGHQFGQWAGQLGDGRAINLGSVNVADGKHLTLQLKGAGPTPYSRTADGLAVLRSSVREFLCSEAMFHLGVPTTRALSLVTTGEQVMRDMFYDGNAAYEMGAVVCRVSPSFVRFGNFQLPASRGDYALLKQLVDFTIVQDYPHLGEPNKDSYIAFYRDVCERTMSLMVEWMRVGFVHGVMNTDNLSILGETIDYGPYGWLEDYDPQWTPNTTDAGGRRYAYGRQPAIAQWNLAQLGSAIAPLVEDTEPLQTILNGCEAFYQQHFELMMANKLGFPTAESEDVKALVYEVADVLQLVETDMTIFYRSLADISNAQALSDDDIVNALAQAFYQREDLTGEKQLSLTTWINRWLSIHESMGIELPERRARMNAVNPKYVLRNYLSQLAIDAAEKGDFSRVEEQLAVLRNPYDEQPGKEAFAEKRPEWARERAGCSMLSCSS